MTPTLLIALAILIQPDPLAHELDGDTLTVTGASYSHVANLMGNAGGQVVLVQGDMLGDPSWAHAAMAQPDIVWQLPPGQYNVRAWGPLDDEQKRPQAEWVVEVAPEDRIDQIWLLLAQLDSTRAELAALDPTDEELAEALSR